MHIGAVAAIFKRSNLHALTLVELLVGIVIFTLLAATLYAASGRILPTVDRVRCTSNLKSLHGIFAYYLDSNGHWPSQPRFTGRQQKEYERWWFETMESYGATRGHWTCPAIRRLIRHAPEEERPLIHYSPTMFDSFHNRPFQWSTMPWLVEIADAHGHGALVLFPDGSIRDFDQFMPRAEP